MRLNTIRHEFVEFIPARLESDVAYVSIAYDTVVHSCFCGCGNRVATPLSPTDWRLTYDGESISLDPSVGNWQFPCRSHYVIRRNTVRWAGDWTESQVSNERSFDIAAKQAKYAAAISQGPPDQTDRRLRGWLRRARLWRH